MEFDRHWEAERRFWLDGPEFYGGQMARDALMVFPAPVGILAGGAIVAGLDGAPRWQSVEMLERSATRLGGTVVLAYRASAERDGQEPYRALCSSTYALAGGAWLLLSHQQTPL